MRRTVAMLVVAGVLIAGGCGSEQNPTVDETPDTGGQEQESDSGPGY